VDAHSVEVRTFVGVLRSELVFPGLRTLKERRGCLVSLLDRLRGIGMSAAQVGPADFVRRAWVSACCASGSDATVRRMLERAAAILDSPVWELASLETDMFEAGDPVIGGDE